MHGAHVHGERSGQYAVEPGPKEIAPNTKFYPLYPIFVIGYNF